jgi:uncharacterized membrane protein
MTDNFPLSGFRDIPIDILRGFAITMMVGANMIPYLFLPPVPFWIRIFSSIAAPLFIFLSGMMVALSRCRKQYDLVYFLIRGGVVVFIGVLLDMIGMGLIPFTSIDVLYLIGISLPLGYLYISLGTRSRWALIAAIFCITPLVQLVFGYTQLPVQIPIVNTGSIVSTIPITEILRQWFVDGWFPVLPWLGIALSTHVGFLPLRYWDNLMSVRYYRSFTANSASRSIPLSWRMLTGNLYTSFNNHRMVY